MRLSFVEQSSDGPKRAKNEDCLGHWQSDDLDERTRRGAVAVVADGVGGASFGEVASRLATDTAIGIFRNADPGLSPRSVLNRIFNQANAVVFEGTPGGAGHGRMATTLTVCIFRDRELHIGHVGDSRVYLVRNGEIQRLTNDHSYTGLQLKLRLITEHEARASHLRSMLTRSVGSEPMVRCDYQRLKLLNRDRLVLCTDGLYCFVNDGEISEGADRLPLDEVCPYLIALAERRATDDNLSVQVVQVDRLHEPKYDNDVSVLRRVHADRSPAMAHEVQVGDILDGRFEVQEVISRSGMASIYRAFDRTAEKLVAVKVPHMQFESDPGTFARFQREAEIGQRLDHPNILRFYSVPDQSRPYIVTELLQGRTLSDLLNEVRPLPLRDAVGIAASLCDALAHMHSHNVVHRDLKPQNIMVCDDGTLRIMDFGIAKSTELRRLTFAGFSPAMGTPDYMAPEQVKGRRGDERTDIYSLGAILYEMATGSVPFEGANPFIVMNSRLTGDPVAPRRRNPAISAELEEVILHAMEREPPRRYASAAEMKKELEEPETVRLAGRHQHLKSPRVWKARWQGARVIVLSSAVPLLVFVGAIVLARCHPGGH